MKLHSSVKHKGAFIVSILVILAIAGSAVAYYPPAQQPTTEKILDNKIEVPSTALQFTLPEVKPPPKGEIYTVTAYDLSIQSCGKSIGAPGYGKTASGYSLAGHTWYSAKSIAVDPNRIPLGSKVLIKFLDEKFHMYNGVYTARDTGGAIRGDKIDFFMGDFESNETSDITWAFGKRQAEIIILGES